MLQTLFCDSREPADAKALEDVSKSRSTFFSPYQTVSYLHVTPMRPINLLLQRQSRLRVACAPRRPTPIVSFRGLPAASL